MFIRLHLLPMQKPTKKDPTHSWNTHLLQKWSRNEIPHKRLFEIPLRRHRGSSPHIPSLRNELISYRPERRSLCWWSIHSWGCTYKIPNKAIYLLHIVLELTFSVNRQKSQCTITHLTTHLRISLSPMISFQNDGSVTLVLRVIVRMCFNHLVTDLVDV